MTVELSREEQLLVDAGWRIEECATDRHALRKGAAPTYRIYVPPHYREALGGPIGISWSLEDALQQQGFDRAGVQR